MRKDTKNLIGKKFGKLTVLTPVENNSHRGVSWNCKCDCGNECVAYGGHLRAKGRKSCGCLKEERIEQTGINILISLYKQKSLLKNVVFDLTRDEFIGLVKGNCFYCDTPPRQIIRRNKTAKIQIIYNGIDKVNPKKHYIASNCVSCCKYCNQGKSTLSVEEFKNHIKKIVKCLKIT